MWCDVRVFDVQLNDSQVVDGRLREVFGMPELWGLWEVYLLGRWSSWGQLLQQETYRQNSLSSQYVKFTNLVVAQWNGFRLSTKRTRVPVLWCCVKPSTCFFTRHWSSSLSCMNEYLAVDSGGYLYKQPSRITYIIAGCFSEKLIETPFI